MIMLLPISLVILLMLQLGTLRHEPLILYHQTQYGTFRLWDTATNRSVDVITLNALGTGPKIVPTWSPDGSQFAFILRETSSEGGQFSLADNLFLSDAVGRNFQRLLDIRDMPSLSNAIADPKIVWSPDGRYIAFYLDLFDAPQLWIVTPSGEIITHIASNFIDVEHENILPTGGLLVWSADSQRLLILTSHNGFRYQTLRTEQNASLSEPDPLTLPPNMTLDVRLNENIVRSPVSAEILLYRQDAESVWLMNVETGETQEITAIPDASNLTALAWSDDGTRIGWVQRELRESSVFTLSLADNTLTQYTFEGHFANDLSFTMWLPDNPPQVIIRMQRGAFCHSVGESLHCTDPNFFSASWFGVQP